MGSQFIKDTSFAAFDIDGTIFRWQLYHELFDAFVEGGIISLNDAEPVFAAREAWRQRSNEYISYEHELIHVMQKTIVGLEESRFNAIADTILKSKGHHVYRYTVDLLQQLKRAGYIIIAISGSHQQLVDRFAVLHGIDIAIGRNHTIQDGRVTDASTEIFGRKDEVLRQTVEANKLSWQGSYAIGDSGSDAAMLRLVENPIAFNPDDNLKTEAMVNGWPIVIERKSITYRLEKAENGSYILA
jgi:HAD superfamily hydrolase (TIGR01490 family)